MSSDFILTHTGKQFWMFDPLERDIDIVDIAHSLSQQCRFAGHTRVFYSVAQHCCEMFLHADRDHQAEALLHDAAEAYITDIPRPLKRQLKLNDIERRIEWCICSRFGVHWPWSEELHALDNRMLATESRDLMADQVLKGVEPFGRVIQPLPPRCAEELFLSRFSSLVIEGKVKA